MNDYLVFDTEQEAKTALEAIYANMVAAISVPSLLDVTTDQEVPQTELTDDERAEYTQQNRRFPVFGVNAKTGIKNHDEGYTTAWAIAQETLQGKWVFQKPEEAMLDGVIGYTLESYDPAWFPQGTIDG
jgi:hypothetical protein